MTSITHRALHIAFRIAALLAAAAPGAALAQHFEAVDLLPWPSTVPGRFPAYVGEAPRPTTIYAQAGVLRDNNIFRLSRDANAAALLGTTQRSDTVYRAGLGIRTEQRVFGRQTLRFEARGEENAFERFHAMDHFAYGLRGEWAWEFTNDLSGTIGYEQRKRLADLAQLQAPVKDMITEKHAFATAAYLVGPSVRLRGALDNARADRSLIATASTHTNTALAAVDYVTALGNALGVEARYTSGTFPVDQTVGAGVLVNNDFTERELALVASYTTSPQLRVTGRVGRTNRHHQQFSQRDFSGNTGRVQVDWVPLQKTGFEFAAYREPRSIVDIAASYVLVTGISFGPRWAPQEKLVFSALLSHERQDFRGDPAVVVAGAVQRSETVRTFRLGAGWEPRRFLQLSAGLEHGYRESNVALRDFNFTAVMANARFQF